jgi:hypothetical protein
MFPSNLKKAMWAVCFTFLIVGLAYVGFWPKDIVFLFDDSSGRGHRFVVVVEEDTLFQGHPEFTGIIPTTAGTYVANGLEEVQYTIYIGDSTAYSGHLYSFKDRWVLLRIHDEGPQYWSITVKEFVLHRYFQ